MLLLDVFAGIGGFSLAARWAGWRTIGFVEIDKFCQRVLRKNFPGVVIVDDIKTVTAKSFQRPDIITGGFPCQDISIANANATGLDGDRSGLWFEMLRIVELYKPRWTIIENVARLEKMGLDTVLDGLESAGYTAQSFVIPACAVGAPHRRDRIWIVAHADSDRNDARRRDAGRNWPDAAIRPELQHESIGHDSIDSNFDRERQSQQGGAVGEIRRRDSDENQSNPADIACIGGERRIGGRGGKGQSAFEITNGNRPDWSRSWVEAATEFCRISDGISEELDADRRNRRKRIRMLGNSIVPEVAFQIFAGIKAVEAQLALGV